MLIIKDNLFLFFYFIILFHEMCYIHKFALPIISKYTPLSLNNKIYEK